MIQNFTALDTIYRKTHGKQTTYRSPRGTEKQIEYILIKRRHLKYRKDAGPNDMIHMGSDHRCAMATFVINTPKKDGRHDANKDKRSRTKQNIRTQTDKKDGEEEPSVFEKNDKKAVAQSKKRKQKWIQEKKVKNSLNIAC